MLARFCVNRSLLNCVTYFFVGHSMTYMLPFSWNMQSVLVICMVACVRCTQWRCKHCPGKLIWNYILYLKACESLSEIAIKYFSGFRCSLNGNLCVQDTVLGVLGVKPFKFLEFCHVMYEPASQLGLMGGVSCLHFFCLRIQPITRWRGRRMLLPWSILADASIFKAAQFS